MDKWCNYDGNNLNKFPIDSNEFIKEFILNEIKTKLF